MRPLLQVSLRKDNRNLDLPFNFLLHHSIGLIMYEFMITFNKEVELFWRRRFTLSSILFLVNRYVPLVVNMIYAPWPSNTSPTTLPVRAVIDFLGSGHN